MKITKSLENVIKGELFVANMGDWTWLMCLIYGIALSNVNNFALVIDIICYF